MTTVTTRESQKAPAAVRRADRLAERLEQGARSLAALAAGLSEEEWRTRMPKDGRTVGVIVHHVASVYPIEIELAQRLSAGQTIDGVTVDDIHAMNARHAQEHADVSRTAAIELLEQNSANAAAAIRALSDEELDRAATASLYGGAPITCQFMLEDHAVRHSFHHLAKVRAALKR